MKDKHNTIPLHRQPPPWKTVTSKRRKTLKGSTKSESPHKTHNITKQNFHPLCCPSPFAPDQNKTYKCQCFSQNENSGGKNHFGNTETTLLQCFILTTPQCFVSDSLFQLHFMQTESFQILHMVYSIFCYFE